MKMTKYFSYKDQSNGRNTAAVEEDYFLAQLHEAIQCRKGEYSKQELEAATGIMLLHHQIMGTPTLFLHNNVQHQEPNLETALLNEFDAAIKKILSGRLRSDNLKSSILTCCKNILREYFSRNSG